MNRFGGIIMGLSMYLWGIGETRFVEEMYWCKDYIMHQWFVENIQNGINDGKRYFVSRKKMKEFIEYCKNEIKNFKADDDDGEHHLYCCNYAIKQWERIKDRYTDFCYRGW